MSASVNMTNDSAGAPKNGKTFVIINHAVSKCNMFRWKNVLRML